MEEERNPFKDWKLLIEKTVESFEVAWDERRLAKRAFLSQSMDRRGPISRGRET